MECKCGKKMKMMADYMRGRLYWCNSCGRLYSSIWIMGGSEIKKWFTPRIAKEGNL